MARTTSRTTRKSKSGEQAEREWKQCKAWVSSRCLCRWHRLTTGLMLSVEFCPFASIHPRCEAGGLSALEQYRREWDDEKKCFKPTAVHDWTSHPADAFRYLAMSWKKLRRAQSICRKTPAGVFRHHLRQGAEEFGYEEI